MSSLSGTEKIFGLPSLLKKGDASEIPFGG